MKQTADDFDWPVYLNAVAARKGKLILAGTFAWGAALLVSLILPKTYETHITIRIGRVSFEGSQGSSYNRSVFVETGSELAEIITSPGFLKEIGDALGLKVDIQTLVKRVRPLVPDKAEPGRMGVLTIGVRGPTPADALRLADAIADRTIERHNKDYRDALAVRGKWENDFADQIKFAEDELAALKRAGAEYRQAGKPDSAMVALQVDMEDRQSMVAKLREKYRQVQLENSEFMSRQSQLVSPSYLPEKPIKPNVPLNTGLGAAAGLFLYLAYIFIKEAVRVGSTPR